MKSGAGTVSQAPALQSEGDLTLILCQTPLAETPKLIQGWDSQCEAEESRGSGNELLWWQTVGVGDVD